MATNLHKIIVIGGGAGGLELITALGHTRKLLSKCNLTLLDGRSTHIWKPLLHEVATGAFNSGEDEVNYFPHGSENNYKFILGMMGGLDKERKVIKLNELKYEKMLLRAPTEIPYDTLVLAVGAVPDTFGIPGVKEHCMFLNSPRQADAIRLGMLNNALSILYGASKIQKLRIGIVGAGATGVELAAELHRLIEAGSFTGFRMDQVEITILEAGPRILGMAETQLSKFADEMLKKKGIEVMTNVKLLGVTDKGFQLGDGKLLEKELRIWTAGVKAPDWLSKTGLQTHRTNRLLTNNFLQSLDDPSIYAIGDCACVPFSGNDHTSSLPATAQVAHQQASWLRNHLTSKIIGKDNSTQFKYNPQGFLVSLGHHTAVGSLHIIKGLKDYQIEGHIAKGLYTTLYRKHQVALYGMPKTMSLWVGDQFRHMVMPQLKFH